MLSPQNRLKKKGDINNVFRKGRNLAGNFVFLRVAKNDLGLNRFAFVVSLRVSKKSVSRNKIKRQLREIIRKIILKTKQGFDFVVTARPQIINQKFQDIEKEINEIFYLKFDKDLQKKRF